MAKTVVYKLWSSVAAGSTANLSQCKILKPGRICAAYMQWIGVGGAATGAMMGEVTRNSTAGGSSSPWGNNNDPFRELGVIQLLVQTVTGAPFTQATSREMLSIPVFVGDVLNLGTITMSGTTAGSGMLNVEICVIE